MTTSNGLPTIGIGTTGTNSATSEAAACDEHPRSARESDGRASCRRDRIRDRLGLALPAPGGRERIPIVGSVIGEWRVGPEDWDEAISAVDGPQLVVAGPGTGKTEFLVRRVTHLLDEGHDPASILVLTFSRRGAADLRSRIAALRLPLTRTAVGLDIPLLCDPSHREARSICDQPGSSPHAAHRTRAGGVGRRVAVVGESRAVAGLAPSDAGYQDLRGRRRRLPPPDGRTTDRVRRAADDGRATTRLAGTPRLRRSLCRRTGPTSSDRLRHAVVSRRRPRRRPGRGERDRCAVRGGRRVPGHLPRPGGVARAPDPDPPEPHGRRRSASVHLRIPRRRRAEHRHLRRPLFDVGRDPGSADRSRHVVPRPGTRPGRRRTGFRRGRSAWGPRGRSPPRDMPATSRSTSSIRRRPRRSGWPPRSNGSTWSRASPTGAWRSSSAPPATCSRNSPGLSTGD
jgi:hypothetical protein